MSLKQLAHSQAKVVLQCIIVQMDDLERLVDHLERGLFSGQEARSCFFGILSADTVSGYRQLRRFTGMDDVIDSDMNPIERYCKKIKKGDSPKNNQRALSIWLWTKYEIHRRKNIKVQRRVDDFIVQTSQPSLV